MNWHNQFIGFAVEYRYVEWGLFDAGDGKIMSDKGPWMARDLLYQETRTWKIGLEGMVLPGLVVRCGGRTGDHYAKRTVADPGAVEGMKLVGMRDLVFACGFGLMLQDLTPHFVWAENIELDLSLESGHRGDADRFFYDYSFTRTMVTLRLGV